MTIDEIAAEAAEKIRGFLINKGSLSSDEIDSIIKSAIEKAHSQGWHEGVRQCANKQRIERERAAAAPATASEQKGW